jgi:RimJ/RimL family protein N-acetyltransferase
MIGLDIYEGWRGLGLSRSVYKNVIQYLFNDLNMNALYLEVLETNSLAIHIYNELGFKKDGTIPQKVFRSGKYINSIHMSKLRSDQ